MTIKFLSSTYLDNVHDTITRINLIIFGSCSLVVSDLIYVTCVEFISLLINLLTICHFSNYQFLCMHDCAEISRIFVPPTQDTI